MTPKEIQNLIHTSILILLFHNCIRKSLILILTGSQPNHYITQEHNLLAEQYVISSDTLFIKLAAQMNTLGLSDSAHGKGLGSTYSCAMNIGTTISLLEGMKILELENKNLRYMTDESVF